MFYNALCSFAINNFVCFTTPYECCQPCLNFSIFVRSGSRLGGVLYEDDVQKERERLSLDKGTFSTNTPFIH